MSTEPPGREQRAHAALLFKKYAAPDTLTAEQAALCQRYDVVTLDELVLAMDAHIERLQQTIGQGN